LPHRNDAAAGVLDEAGEPFVVLTPMSHPVDIRTGKNVSSMHPGDSISPVEAQLPAGLWGVAKMQIQ
jgi:hypothetical protein